MTQKEQLVQYFSTLDVATLQRLEKYSKYLIIPEEDMVSNVNMSQMVDKAHSIADVVFPEWTDRSKSDFGEFLVELFAIFSEKDFWYINAFANESILSKMRSYSNVYSRAISMGYTPITAIGSTASFSILFSAGNATTYSRGDILVKCGEYTFSNDDVFVVVAQSIDTYMSMTLHEGSQFSDDVVFNGYNIFLAKKNIDIKSIKLSIDNIEYTQVNTFGESKSDSSDFMVLPEEDGSCSVFFGDGVFGVFPAIGKNVHVEYRTCSGYKGNIAIGDTVIMDSLPMREATAVIMQSSAVDGKDAESMASIKQSAPLYFKTRKAATNETVAKEILLTYPMVKKANVYANGFLLYYQIIPKSGDLEMTAAEKAALEKEFFPLLLLGFRGENEQNYYMDFITKANAGVPGASIYIDTIIASGYSIVNAEAGIRQVLTDITSPLISADYGKGFSKSDTDLLIRSNIPGVQSVAYYVGTSYAGRTVIPDFQLFSTEILKPIDQSKVFIRSISS